MFTKEIPMMNSKRIHKKALKGAFQTDSQNCFLHWRLSPCSTAAPRRPAQQTARPLPAPVFHPAGARFRQLPSLPAHPILTLSPNMGVSPSCLQSTVPLLQFTLLEYELLKDRGLWFTAFSKIPGIKHIFSKYLLNE